MYDFGQKQSNDTGGASSLPDSPKPHGDKLADAEQGAGGERHLRQESPVSDSAPGTPDSPKPHGDKLANSVQKTTKDGGQGR